MARFRVWFTSCALLMLVAIPLGSQSLPLSNAASWTDKLARPAGMIFSGVVVRIEREQDENGNPTLKSKNTIEAVKFMRELYKDTETPEVFTWDPSSNNRAMLAGKSLPRAGRRSRCSAP